MIKEIFMIMMIEYLVLLLVSKILLLHVSAVLGRFVTFITEFVTSYPLPIFRGEMDVGRGS